MTAGSILFPALLGVALAGCGATPVDYTSDLELKERPGLFSGEKGAFVIRAGGSAKETPKAAMQEPAKPGDYEAFQRWKKERAASDEREFQEWREWREYQEWKKQLGR